MTDTKADRSKRHLRDDITTEDFNSYLAAKAPKSKCPICSSAQFTTFDTQDVGVFPSVSQKQLIDDDSVTLTPWHSVTLVFLAACTNCSFVMPFDRKAVNRWLRSRSGEKEHG